MATISVDTALAHASDSTRTCEYTTQSLTASIYEYRWEHGRRYHAYKPGKYMFPNDEEEQERLDLLHHIYLLMLDDKLLLAPIAKHPKRILDIGTGTGIWAIDAGEYPTAEVIGTDLSPIQPSWVPPNVQFQIDDAESEWTFRKGSVDLVHIRHLGGATRNWDALFKEAYRVCKPGGWIDIAEYEMDIFSDDGSLPHHSELKRFYELVSKAADITGRGFGMAKKLKPLLEKAGFTKVHHQEVKLPLGPWAADRKMKELGALLLVSAEKGFEAFGIQLFTNVLGMSVREAHEFLNTVLSQAKSKHIHSYGLHHFYYGQKPHHA